MTIDLPDDLFRKAKARAALQGRSLKELVAESIALVLRSPETGPAGVSSRRTQFPIIKPQNPVRRLTPEIVVAEEEREELVLHRPLPKPEHPSAPQRARSAETGSKRFMRLAGSIHAARDLSIRKGLSDR
jgi:hypothetical protein